MNKISKLFLLDFAASKEKVSFYYHFDGIKDEFKFVSENTKSNLKLIFPFKSFPNEKIIELISPYIDGFDVSNMNEYDEVQRYNKNNIFSSCPYNEKFPANVKRLVRVNLDEESRFGIPVEDITRKSIIEQKGIHFHNQSWTKNAFVEVKLLIDKLITKYNLKSEELNINIGGGYNELTPKELVTFLNELCDLYPNHLFYLESGRHYIKRHGYVLGRVLDIQNISSIKKSRVISTISSICHLKWELQNSKLDFYSQSINEQETKYENIEVLGPTVYEWDRIAKFNLSKKIKVGDTIIIDNISGYGLSWNHSFNGVDKAKLRYILNGKIIRIK